MREEFKPYFNENFLLSPHGENDIVYTAEFSILSEEYSQVMAQKAIDSLHHPHHPFGPLTIDDFYPNEGDQTWSHDNHTALCCLSKKFGFSYHQQWLWFDSWRRIQPWNIAFYFFIMEGPFHYLGLLLLPILSLYMILNVAFPSYDSDGTLSTSGPLLIFLMLNTVKMPLTNAICNYFVKKKIGNWAKYAIVYFQGSDHPVSKLMLEKRI